MKQKYLYLLINILSISIPLLFSFYKKAPFYKRWKYLGISTLVTAIIFIVWDEVFTQLGVWGFNPDYVLGVYLFSLPLEEILFFICIPYACIFIFFALTHLIEKDYLFPHQELISSALSIILMVWGLHQFNTLYTGITFLATGGFLAYQMIILRPRYMGRFYFAFLFILIPFFIVNSILTGSFLENPIVWYNEAETLGFRIGTIPFEDVFYCLLLLLVNVSIYEWLKLRDRNYDYG